MSARQDRIRKDMAAWPGWYGAGSGARSAPPDAAGCAFWTQETHLLRADEYVCSACGKRSEKPFKQCPGCGRRMKKVKYEAGWVDEIEMWDAIR